MSNTDKVTNYVLKNAGKLSPEKITALAGVLAALRGEQPKVPNEVKEEKANDLIDESHPLDLSKIKRMQFGDMPSVPTRIYKERSH